MFRSNDLEQSGDKRLGEINPLIKADLYTTYGELYPKAIETINKNVCHTKTKRKLVIFRFYTLKCRKWKENEKLS